MTHSRRPWLLLTVGLALSLAAQPAAAKKKKKAQVENAGDLLIVDCALPGRVRQLGRSINYLTDGRRVRTSAVDCRIRGGEYEKYDRGSYASSLEFWLPAANQGDPEAQANVGELYEKGLTATPDHEVAALWYGKAARQGLARAQVNLAHLYARGLGVAENPVLARELYAKAAGISDDEIRDIRRQAEELRRELELLDQKAKGLELQLEAARSERQQAEDQVEELRRRLEQARKSNASAEAERLAADLERRQAEAASKREAERSRLDSLARNRRKAAEFRARRRETKRSAPTIEIIRPDVLTTRGPTLVPVPAGVAVMEIRGKVTAPDGIRDLTIDDRSLSVGEEGFFRANVPVAAEQREVRFVATDRAGRDGRAVLVLLPAGAEITPPPRPPGRGPGEPQDPPAVVTGASHALIIGISEYRHFDNLVTAESDAAAVAVLLADKYGFQTTILPNPGQFRLLRELRDLKNRLQADEYLLIYYAGHGKIEPSKQKGYWIPADARQDDENTWIANESISDYLDAIPARQIMVVSDSCYSGTFASGLAWTGATEPVEKRRAASQAGAARRSRTVLTSGGLQPVLDDVGGEHSLFAGVFLTVLKLSNHALSGAELHREVRTRVEYQANRMGVEQVPQYAPIRFAGHEAGDFVLTPRSRGHAIFR